MKFIIPVILLFAANIAAAYFVEDENVCRELYVAGLPTDKIGRKCYFYLATNKANWFAASHYCSRHHMRLASFDNEEENSLLALDLKETGAYTNLPVGIGAELLWTSGNSLSFVNEWFWMHLGRRIDFSSWKTNEPKDGQNGERCMAVSLVNSSLVWSAEKCERKLNFICEHSYGRIGF